MESELQEIVREMERLVDAYNTAFPSSPRPVNLRLLRRSHRHVLLSWRQACRSGSYLKLFGSDEGTAILERLGPNAINLMASFDRERLQLNFRCKLVWNCRDAYLLYEDGLRAQDACLGRFFAG
jgi:hypothetical protein